MFEEVQLLEKYYYMLHPRPTIVLITLCPNGRVNAMPASWNTPVSEEPPMLAVAVERETYTYQCLEYHGEATINVPSSDLLDTVYALGTVSGRDVDKIEAFRLRLGKAKRVKPPVWLDAIGVIEARVEEGIDAGEVRLYVFRVLEAYTRPGLYTRWGWDFSKTNILLHGAGRAFYLVGRRVWAKKAAKP